MLDFREQIYPYIQQTITIDELIFRGRSEYQDVLLFRNDYFGHVLVLDGVVQLTERDEFVYSEMFAHVPLSAHPDPRRILIVGGGDGGVLEEVLKHPSVEQVVLVDIDALVVELCREHFIAVHRGAFDDPRTTVLVADGLVFARGTRETFDVVLLDGPDPIGPGEAGCPLYSDEFLRLCATRLLRDGGLFVAQNDVPFHHPQAMKQTCDTLRGAFGATQSYVAPVPSYLGGHMVFVCAAKGTVLDASRPRCRLSAPDLGYYSESIHEAAFKIPPYINAASRTGLAPSLPRAVRQQE